jgi:hypothetical protein
MINKILVGLVLVVIAIQFVPTEKNESTDMQYDISTKYSIPADVNVILKNACNDCHSNNTTYPWYSNIQPVGFWLDHHVNDGKKHLNFSTFTKLPIAVQNHKLEEVIEQTEEKEMPMPSYTYLGLHSNANLSEEQRNSLINWAKGEMAKLKASYPADSLKMKPRKKA